MPELSRVPQSFSQMTPPSPAGEGQGSNPLISFMSRFLNGGMKPPMIGGQMMGGGMRGQGGGDMGLGDMRGGMRGQGGSPITPSTSMPSIDQSAGNTGIDPNAQPSTSVPISNTPSTSNYGGGLFNAPSGGGDWMSKVLGPRMSPMIRGPAGIKNSMPTPPQ